MTPDLYPEELARVLAREPRAIQHFVQKYGASLRGVIRRFTARAGRPAENEEDLLQEALKEVFADDARVLRAWVPDKGRSLKNFLCTLARRRCIDYLRQQVREVPTEESELQRVSEGMMQPAGPGEAQEWLDVVVSHFRAECSEEEWHFFEWVFLAERSTEEVAAEFGLTHDAVYQRKRRQRLRLLKLKKELFG